MIVFSSAKIKRKNEICKYIYNFFLKEKDFLENLNTDPNYEPILLVS